MSKIPANELARKAYILIDGAPYLVQDVTFASPSARGASTMVKVRVRNLINGTVLDKNFKTSEVFDEPDIEKTTVSLMYADADGFNFMDDATFEQFTLSKDKLADLAGYLKEGVAIQAVKFNGQVISIELPVYVELKVVSTEPGATFAGGSNTGKPATLETGIEVKVPPYIKEGDTIRINTQTGEVSGRA